MHCCVSTQCSDITFFTMIWIHIHSNKIKLSPSFDKKSVDKKLISESFDKKQVPMPVHVENRRGNTLDGTEI